MTHSTTQQDTSLSFEDAFTRMQAIVATLEDGKIPLEQAITTFEEGMRLAQYCNDLLDRAQLRIQILEAGSQDENEEESDWQLTELPLFTE